MAAKSQKDLAELLDRRHPDHCEFANRWAWEQDTYEGGDRYRRATYGTDTRGMPLHNLIRYKRDYPDYSAQTTGSAYNEVMEGDDPHTNATTGDFEMRLARTPPPTFLEEAVGIHLAKIYKSTPDREGPGGLEQWWDDVDGKGTSMDQWMQDTIAPLFLINAQIDLCFDHPAAPDGEIVNSRADEMRLGLTKCVASYILPQNMLWWRVDNRGRYVECLVLEPQEDGCDYYRHWTPADWTLYSREDEKIEVVSTAPHPYGRPPIERVLFRKRSRCTHVGVNLYESICELSRAHYNLDSELVLSDSTQAHPTLQAPSDLLGSTIQVGPSNVLPMLKTTDANGAAKWDGFEYLDPPKGAADSIRTNMERIENRIDRLACLTKPAGAAGTGASTVSQSGVSKVLDQSTGNDLLSRLASSLARLERSAACLALLVLGDGNVEAADEKAIRIAYPKTFELADSETLSKTIEAYQGFIAMAGQTPKTETAFVQRFVHVALPGRDDDEYEELDDEIAEYIEAKAGVVDMESESAAMTSDQQPGQPNTAETPAQPTDPASEDEEA